MQVQLSFKLKPLCLQDAALTRETLAWPRLEISSLPSPRILDTNPAAKQKQKREPIALGDALQEIQVVLLGSYTDQLAGRAKS